MTPEDAEKIRVIANQFENADIYTTNIALDHGPGFDPRINDRPKTFSRYSWSNDKFAVFAKTTEGQDKATYLIRFRLNTLTTIGMGEAIPQGEDIPEEKVIGTIAIGFALEYTVATNPADIDLKTLSIIERAKVTQDVWPFWREALQSLALRARLPVPVLPARRPNVMNSPAIPKSQKKPRKKLGKPNK